ncbi:MAG TPA: methylenetetrahydrofolate reductase, partial [Gaiellaceae bacterium]|nr:methylenetetrahydrofolate reductase [Gaiellaceae bacterium]
MSRGESTGQATAALRTAGASTLREALAAGTFAVTAELGPPRSPDPEAVRRTARALAGRVHAANVTDNQAATVKVSPLACAALMLDEGLDPILQVTTRDRNLLALQADLLGAWTLGVRTILALSGDPLHVGPYDTLAKPVWELNAAGLLRVAAGLNEGRLAAGEELDTPTGFLLAAAVNPLVDPLEKIEQKLDAGAHCLQTNIVYDVERFAGWFGPVVAAGVTERAPVIVGVAPPRSSGMLRHLHDRVPGVEVDDATLARLDGLEGGEAKAAGVEVAV